MENKSMEKMSTQPKQANLGNGGLIEQWEFKSRCSAYLRGEINIEDLRNGSN